MRNELKASDQAREAIIENYQYRWVAQQKLIGEKN
jgi:hypothetical protein